MRLSRVAGDVAQVDRAGTVVPVADLFGVRRHPRPEVGQFGGIAHVGRHRELVVGAVLVVVEARLQVEDGPAVLDRDDAPRGEAPTVADPVDLVQDRHGRVTRTQEVGVERVDEPAALADRASGGDERLAGDLPAEDALAVLVG